MVELQLVTFEEADRTVDRLSGRCHFCGHGADFVVVSSGRGYLSFCEGCGDRLEQLFGGGA